MRNSRIPHKAQRAHLAAGRRPSRLRRIVWSLIALCLLVGVAGLGGAAYGLDRIGRTPRQWAPYLERRAQDHRPLIVHAVAWLTTWLDYADWMQVAKPLPLPASLGASPDRSGPTPEGRLRMVDSMAALRQAIATAQPGDVIQLAPGHYRLKGHYLKLVRPGTAAAPIAVRAARLGDVVIESSLIEGFNLSAPYWHFENLVFKGMGNWCEHAIHIVGDGTHLLVRNDRFEDFNAALKINGQNGRFPDDGVVEGNTFTNSKPRRTTSPITPVNLDAASNWEIRDNIITDFVRAGPGGATYGGFAKGAGANNVFERNLVICQWKIRHAPGQQVGLSLGGGGTGLQFRRDKGRSGIEQFGGIIRDNLIVSCGDVGIYLNRAARSVVTHNTLLDTAGIEVRYPQSAARVADNMVDGIIRTRDDAIAHREDNVTSNLFGLFLGWHPVRHDFADPATLNLTWRTRPGLVPNLRPGKDLCGYQRGGESPPGAFDDFSRCLFKH